DGGGMIVDAGELADCLGEASAGGEGTGAEVGVGAVGEDAPVFGAFGGEELLRRERLEHWASSPGAVWSAFPVLPRVPVDRSLATEDAEHLLVQVAVRGDGRGDVDAARA